ncbi:MAG TPA: hypothetical protein VKH43_02560 [Thermoanaerobaculia bacterium]|nr:hypothetical protein [Thermoanaerobaculia bacterium]
MNAAGRTFSGWMLGATVALLLGSAGCSDRMTPARAATILRHSKAFLSGAPESDPVLDGVSSVAMEPAADGREADACVVVFTYHFPPSRGAGGAGQIAAPLTASAYLRRSGAAWTVDDARTRTLIPSWPQLPRTQRPF